MHSLMLEAFSTHGSTQLRKDFEMADITIIFDNGRVRTWTRVIEIDPLTKKIVWEYRHKDFFSLTQGFAQRLPNGNTLITESEKGRAFEITSKKKLVWEYYHPQVQDASNSSYPENYGNRQWIYRMIRYSPAFIEQFLP